MEKDHVKIRMAEQVISQLDFYPSFTGKGGGFTNNVVYAELPQSKAGKIAALEALEVIGFKLDDVHCGVNLHGIEGGVSVPNAVGADVKKNNGDIIDVPEGAYLCFSGGGVEKLIKTRIQSPVLDMCAEAQGCERPRVIKRK